MSTSAQSSTSISTPLAERTLRESAYLLTDLPVGIAGFTFVVTALATGASLAVTLAGLPLLAGALLLARYAAGLERARARALLGVAVAAPPPRPGGTTFTTRLLSPLRDKAAWRAAGYFLLMLPAGTATFCAAVTWWATALLLATLPAWAWALPHNGPDLGDSYWSAPQELAASSLVGLLLLAATPWVIHAITRADRALLRLLGSR